MDAFTKADHGDSPHSFLLDYCWYTLYTVVWLERRLYWKAIASGYSDIHLGKAIVIFLSIDIVIYRPWFALIVILVARETPVFCDTVASIRWSLCFTVAVPCIGTIGYEHYVFFGDKDFFCLFLFTLVITDIHFLHAYKILSYTKTLLSLSILLIYQLHPYQSLQLYREIDAWFLFTFIVPLFTTKPQETARTVFGSLRLFFVAVVTLHYYI